MGISPAEGSVDRPCGGCRILREGQSHMRLRPPVVELRSRRAHRPRGHGGPRVLAPPGLHPFRLRARGDHGSKSFGHHMSGHLARLCVARGEARSLPHLMQPRLAPGHARDGIWNLLFSVWSQSLESVLRARVEVRDEGLEAGICDSARPLAPAATDLRGLRVAWAWVSCRCCSGAQAASCPLHPRLRSPRAQRDRRRRDRSRRAPRWSRR